MGKAILMPQVGQDLTEGEVIELLVKLGDPVKKGDIVAVVESEKASFEVEAFESGTVTEICYAVGDMAKVLEPLIVLDGEGGDAATTSTAQAPMTSSDDGPEAPTGNSAAAPATPAPGGKPRSSPLARRLAKQAGLDLAALSGTGPGGSVVQRDVLAAMETAATAPAASPPAPSAPSAPPILAAAPAAPSPAPPVPPPVAAAPLPSLEREDREEPFTRMRQVIADRLALSKRTIPHFYLHAEADVTDTQTRRRAYAEISGQKVSLNDVLIRATALTLRAFPRMNAHVANDRMILRGAINIGVAVSVENGLMVPVIANTDQLGLTEIAGTMAELAAAARRGMAKSQAPGTFTISNLGMYGVEVQPIINPPEAAILGVGPVREQVRPHKGGIHIRQILSLTLAADHRAVDGAVGAEFLAALVETISTFKPE